MNKKKETKKTYNRRFSLPVTHATTNLPVTNPPQYLLLFLQLVEPQCRVLIKKASNQEQFL
jgi:hypothetical protein